MERCQIYPTICQCAHVQTAFKTTINNLGDCIEHSHVHTFDSSNALKAIEDALQHRKTRSGIDYAVYRNDQWIDEDWTKRFLGVYDEVLIVIETVGPENDSLGFVGRVLDIAHERGVVPREEG